MILAHMAGYKVDLHKPVHTALERYSTAHDTSILLLCTANYMLQQHFSGPDTNAQTIMPGQLGYKWVLRCSLEHSVVISVGQKTSERAQHSRWMVRSSLRLQWPAACANASCTGQCYKVNSDWLTGLLLRLGEYLTMPYEVRRKVKVKGVSSRLSSARIASYLLLAVVIRKASEG